MSLVTNRSSCILLTIPNFVTAGSQYVLLSLYKIYKEHHRTFILVDDVKGRFPDEVNHDDRLVIPKSGYLGIRKGIEYSLRLAKLLRKNKISVVHSWDYRSEIWEALACRFAGVPYVFTKKNNAWSRKWKFKSRLATRIAYDHPKMLERFFKSESLSRKTVFIPHGVRTDLFKPDGVPTGVKKVIGCIGNIGPNKNQMVILRALTQVNQNIQCRFYGNADAKYLESMQHYIREHQLSGNVSIMGFVENEKLPAILHELDILILSSYNEGLPVILLEAMASGIYCLASHSGGGSEFLVDTCKSGDLFDPDDAGQLASLINEFYSDPKAKQQQVAQAVSRVTENFSVEQEGKKYLELFADL